MATAAQNLASETGGNLAIAADALTKLLDLTKQLLEQQVQLLVELQLHSELLKSGLNITADEIEARRQELLDESRGATINAY